jgi:hypothetical protein
MIEKRSRGQPKFEPTSDQRNTVKIMKVTGIPETLICKCITNPRTGKSVSPATLARAFAVELETGETELHALVADFLICTILGRKPPSGEPIKNDQARVAAAIFFAKTRMGWRETSVHQHEGKDGGKAIVFQITKTDTQI